MQRLAYLEIKFAENNILLTNWHEYINEDEDIYFVFSSSKNEYRRNDIVPNCFCGEIVKLIPFEQKEKYLDYKDYLKPKFIKHARRAIWVGKNRIGLGCKDNWIAIPSFDECRGNWKRINPQTQVYDIETGAVTMKVKDNPELRKKIQESIAAYEQSEEYQTFLQEQNRLAQIREEARLAEYARLMAIEEEKRNRKDY